MSTVLIVDDSPSMRQLIKTTLEAAGHRVIQAVDGVDALAAAQHNDLDLVITDVHMPNMDGITLVAKLRELEATRLTPILVLTTELDDERKKQARANGATGWMNKPIDDVRMLTTIARVLE